MKQSNNLSPAILLVLSLATAPAQVTVTNQFNGINKVIPDGSVLGIADTRRIEAQGIVSITDVQVQLTIDGGMNGDLYCYLVHDRGFVVLVNRPGRSSANPIGYEDAGFSATFSSQATNDFHFYQQTASASDSCHPVSIIAGLCAADAREGDPAAILENAPRTKGLASFEGLNPNGEWTLFVADLSSGAQGTLKDWGLVVTGTAAPATELRLAKAPTAAPSSTKFPALLFAHSTPNVLP